MPRVALPRGDRKRRKLWRNERLLATALCCYESTCALRERRAIRGLLLLLSLWRRTIPPSPLPFSFPFFRRALILSAPPPPSLLPPGPLPRLLCKGPCPASERAPRLHRPPSRRVVGGLFPAPPLVAEGAASHRLPRQAWGWGGRRGGRRALWREKGEGGVCSERGMWEGHACERRGPWPRKGGGGREMSHARGGGTAKMKIWRRPQPFLLEVGWSSPPPRGHPGGEGGARKGRILRSSLPQARSGGGVGGAGASTDSQAAPCRAPRAPPSSPPACNAPAPRRCMPGPSRPTFP